MEYNTAMKRDWMLEEITQMYISSLPKGREFDSRWCHWYLLLKSPFRLNYDPGVDTACYRNEYQDYFRGRKDNQYVGLTTLLPLCADCLEIWEPQPPGTFRACTGIALLLYSGFSIKNY